MKTILKAMQKRNSGIPSDVLSIFESIMQVHDGGHDCDNEFSKAMEEHLTQEQRFCLYEQNLIKLLIPMRKNSINEGKAHKHR